MPVTKQVKPAKVKPIRTKWLQNATRSIGGATVTELKSYAPNVSNILQSSAGIAKKMVRPSKPKSEAQISTSLKNNKYVRSVDKAFKNALTDLSQGYIFGNDNRGNTSTDAALDDMFSSGASDSGVSFGDTGDQYVQYTVNNSVSNDILNGIGEAVNASSERSIKMTKAQTDAQIAVMGAQMAQISEATNAVTMHLSGMENNLASLVEFNNNNMNAFIESASAYFDRMGKAYEDEAEEEHEVDVSDIMRGGKFDSKAYKKYLTARMKKEFADVGMLAEFLQGDMLDQLVDNPLSMVPSFVIGSIMPKVVTTTAKGLEETFNAAMPAMINGLQRFGQEQGNSLVGKMIKGITNAMGFDSGKNTYFDADDVTVKRGAIPFDGETKTYITHTIPSILSESNAYLKNISLYIEEKRFEEKLKNAKSDANTVVDKKNGRIYHYTGKGGQEGLRRDLNRDEYDYWRKHRDEIDKDPEQMRHFYQNRRLEIESAESNNQGLANNRQVWNIDKNRFQTQEELGASVAKDIRKASSRGATASDFAKGMDRVVGGDKRLSAMNDVFLTTLMGMRGNENMAEQMQQLQDSLMNNWTTVQQINEENANNPNGKKKKFEVGENDAVAQLLYQQLGVKYDKNGKIDLSDSTTKQIVADVNDYVGTAAEVLGSRPTAQLTFSSLPHLSANAMQRELNAVKRGPVTNALAAVPYFQRINEATGDQMTVEEISQEDARNEYLAALNGRRGWEKEEEREFDIQTTLDRGEGVGKNAAELFRMLNQSTSAGRSDFTKAFLSGDTQGLYSAMGKTFEGAMTTITDSMNTHFFVPMKNAIFGNRNDAGFSEGGLLSSAENTILDMTKEVSHTITGKAYTDSQGVEHPADDTAIAQQVKREFTGILFGKDVIDENGNATRREGLVGMVTSTVKEGMVHWHNVMFGELDKDGNEVNSDNVVELMTKSIKDKLPQATEGAMAGGAIGLASGGLLGTMIGGPLGGAAIGATLGFIGKSDKFNTWLFGEEDKDNGFISKKTQDYVNKNKNSLMGGAALGAIGGQAFVSGALGSKVGGFMGSLVGGPVAGALLGVAATTALKSESFHKFLWGDEERGRPGIVNQLNKILKASEKDVKSILPTKSAVGSAILGTGAGALTASAIGHLGIMGASLSPVGIVVGSLVGLGMSIKSQSGKFHEFLFGNGKDQSEDDYQAGIFGQFKNMLIANVLYPMKNQFTMSVREIGDAIRYDVLDVVEEMAEPVATALRNTVGKVGELGMHVFDRVFGFVEENAGAPLVNAVKTAIVKPIMTIGGMVTKAATTVVKNVITMPFRAARFLANALASPVLGIFKGIFGGIGRLTKKGFDAVVSSGIAQATKSIFNTIFGRIKGVFNGIRDIGSLIGRGVRNVQDAASARRQASYDRKWGGGSEGRRNRAVENYNKLVNKGEIETDAFGAPKQSFEEWYQKRAQDDYNAAKENGTLRKDKDGNFVTLKEYTDKYWEGDTAKFADLVHESRSAKSAAKGQRQLTGRQLRDQERNIQRIAKYTNNSRYEDTEANRALVERLAGKKFNWGKVDAMTPNETVNGAQPLNDGSKLSDEALANADPRSLTPEARQAQVALEIRDILVEMNESKDENENLANRAEAGRRTQAAKHTEFRTNAENEYNAAKEAGEIKDDLSFEQWMSNKYAQDENVRNAYQLNKTAGTLGKNEEGKDYSLDEFIMNQWEGKVPEELQKGANLKRQRDIVDRFSKRNLKNGRSTDKRDLQFIMDWMTENDLISDQDDTSKWTRQRLIQEASDRGGQEFADFILDRSENGRENPYLRNENSMMLRMTGNTRQEEARKMQSKISSKVNKIGAARVENPGFFGRKYNEFFFGAKYDDHNQLINTPFLNNRHEIQAAYQEYLDAGETPEALDVLSQKVGFDLSTPGYLAKFKSYINDEGGALLTGSSMRDLLDSYGEPTKEDIYKAIVNTISNGDTRMAQNIFKMLGLDENASIEDESVLSKLEDYVNNAGEDVIDKLSRIIPRHAKGTDAKGVPTSGVKLVGEEGPELINAEKGDTVTPLSPLTVAITELTGVMREAYGIQKEQVAATETLAEAEVQTAEAVKENAEVEAAAAEESAKTEEAIKEAVEDAVAKDDQEKKNEPDIADLLIEMSANMKETAANTKVTADADSKIMNGEVGFDSDGNGSGDVTVAEANKSGENLSDQTAEDARRQGFRARAGSYLGQKAQKARNAVTSRVDGMIENVKNGSTAKKVKSGVSTLIETGKSLLWMGLASAFIKNGGLTFVTNALGGAIKFIGNNLPTVMDAVSGGLQTVFGWFEEHGEAVLDTVGDAFTWIATEGPELISNIASIATNIASVAGNVASILSKVVGGGVDYIDEEAYALENNETTNEEDASEADTIQAAEVATSAGQLIADVGGAVASNGGASTLATITSKIPVIGKTTSKAISSVYKAATGNELETSSTILGAIKDSSTGIAEGKGSYLTQAIETIENITHNIINWALNKLGTSIEDNKILSAISSLSSELTSWVKGLEQAAAEKVAAGLQNVFTTMSSDTALAVASGGITVAIRIGTTAIMNANGTAELFYVNREDVDTYMDVIAAAFCVIKSIPVAGPLLEFLDSIMTALGHIGVLTLMAYSAYNLIAGFFDENASEKLDEAREAFKESYEDYNRTQAYAEYDEMEAAGILPTNDDGTTITREEYYQGVQDGTYEGSKTSFADYNTSTNKNLGQTVTSGALSIANRVGSNLSDFGSGIANFAGHTYKYYDDTRTGNIYIKHNKKWDVYSADGEQLTEEPITTEIMEMDLNEGAELKSTRDLEDIFGENASEVDLEQDDNLGEKLVKGATSTAESISESVDNLTHKGAHLADDYVTYYSDTESGNVYVKEGDTWTSYDSSGNMLTTDLSEDDFKTDVTGSVRSLDKSQYSDLDLKRLMYATYDSESTGSSALDNALGDKSYSDVEAEVVGLEDGYCWYNTSDGCYYTMESDGTYTYRSMYGGELAKNISQETMTSIVIQDSLVKIRIENATSALSKASASWRQSIADLTADTSTTYYKNTDGSYTEVDAAGNVLNEEVSEEDVNASVESGTGTISETDSSSLKYIIVPNTDYGNTNYYVPMTDSDGTVTYMYTDAASTDGISTLGRNLTYDQVINNLKNVGYDKVVTDIENGWYQATDGSNSYYLIDPSGTTYTKTSFSGGSTALESEADVLADISSGESATTTDTSSKTSSNTSSSSTSSTTESATVTDSGYGTVGNSGVISGTGTPFDGTTYEYASGTGADAIYNTVTAAGVAGTLTAEQIQKMLDTGGSGTGTKKTKPGNSIVKMGGGFGDNGSNTLSTNNGFAYASQDDSRWANTKYEYQNDGGTMSDSGCGPTAMSMVVTDATGMNVSPTQMAEMAQEMGDRDETGTNWDYIGRAATSYGLSSVQTLNPSTDDIISSVDSGNPVVLSGTSYGDETPYTSAGHYVVAVGTDADGNVLVNDPRGTQYSRAYNPDELAGYTGSSWEIGGGKGTAYRKNRIKHRGGRGKVVQTADGTTSTLLTATGDRYKTTDGYYYLKNADGTYSYYNSAGKLINSKVSANEVSTLLSKGSITVDTTSNTVTDTDMRNNFPFLLQWDSRWGSTSYTSTGNSSQTIANSGCGPTSMAMILRSYGNNVTPKDTAKWSVDHGHRTANSGTDWSYFSDIGSEYGLSTESIAANSSSTMLSRLQNNIPLVASMHAGDFTKGGHFITLVGLDGSGNVVVNDPNSKERSDKTWAANTISNQANNFWAISKNGSGSINNLTAAGAINEAASETTAAQEAAAQDNQTEGSISITDRYGNYLQGVADILTQAAMTGDFSATDIDDFTALWNSTGSTASTTTTSTSGTTTSGTYSYANASGSDNAEKIWNYLTTTGGFSKAGAAGAMGNMRAESGLDPKNMEDWFQSRLSPTYTDDTYTAAVDNGTYSSKVQYASNYYGHSNYQYGGTFDTDKVGYGLVQWTSDDRKKGLLNQAKTNNTSVADIGTQLQYLLNEIASSSYYSKVLPTMQSGTSPTEAAATWYKYIESGGSTMPSSSNRATYATEYYNKFAGSAAGKGKKGETKYKLMLPGGKGVSCGETVSGSAADAREAIVGWMLCLIGQNTYDQSQRSRVMEGVDGHGYGDCSSTCCKIYSTCLGMSIGSYTGDMYNKGTQILGPNTDRGSYPDESYMLPGDLVFYYSNAADANNLGSSIGHVEMYLGSGTLAGHGSGTGPRTKSMSTYRVNSSYGPWATVVRYINDGTTYTITKPDESKYKTSNQYTDGNGKSAGNLNVNAGATATTTSSTTTTAEATAASNDSIISQYGNYLSGVANILTEAAMTGDYSGTTTADFAALWNGTSTGTSTTTSTATGTSTSSGSASNDGTTELEGAAAIIKSADSYMNTLNSAVSSGEKWIYSNSNKYVNLDGTFEEMVRSADDGSLQRGGNETSIATWVLRKMGILPSGKTIRGNKSHSIGGYTGQAKTNIDEAFDIEDLSSENYPTISTLYGDSRLRAGDIILGDGNTYVYRGSGVLYDSGHGAKNWSSDDSIESDDSKKAVFSSWISAINSGDSGKTTVNHIMRAKPEFTTSNYNVGTFPLTSTDSTADEENTTTSGSNSDVVVGNYTMSAAGTGHGGGFGAAERKQDKKALEIIKKNHLSQGDGKATARKKVSLPQNIAKQTKKVAKFIGGGKGVAYGDGVSDTSSMAGTTITGTAINTTTIYKADKSTGKSVNDIITATNKSQSNNTTTELLNQAITLLQTIASNSSNGVNYLQQATDLIGKLNTGSSTHNTTYVTNGGNEQTPITTMGDSLQTTANRNLQLAKKIAAGK